MSLNPLKLYLCDQDISKLKCTEKTGTEQEQTQLMPLCCTK